MYITSSKDQKNRKSSRVNNMSARGWIGRELQTVCLVFYRSLQSHSTFTRYTFTKRLQVQTDTFTKRLQVQTDTFTVFKLRLELRTRLQRFSKFKQTHLQFSSFHLELQFVYKGSLSSNRHVYKATPSSNRHAYKATPSSNRHVYKGSPSSNRHVYKATPS